MMHFEHMNDHDLNMRYRNMIVKAKNRPFYITRAHKAYDVITFEGMYLHTNRVTEVQSKDVDSKPIRLGFVNGFHYPLRAVRKPSRLYKQGINSKNTKLLIHDSDGYCDYRPFDRNDRILFGGIYQLIKNEYPSYNDALKLLDDVDHPPSVAFNRAFCLFKHQKITIHNGNWVVGHVNDNGEPILDNKFIYFQEQLRRSMQ